MLCLCGWDLIILCEWNHLKWFVFDSENRLFANDSQKVLDGPKAVNAQHILKYICCLHLELLIDPDCFAACGVKWVVCVLQRNINPAINDEIHCQLLLLLVLLIIAVALLDVFCYSLPTLLFITFPHIKSQITNDFLAFLWFVFFSMWIYMFDLFIAQSIKGTALIISCFLHYSNEAE